MFKWFCCWPGEPLQVGLRVLLDSSPVLWHHPQYWRCESCLSCESRPGTYFHGWALSFPKSLFCAWPLYPKEMSLLDSVARNRIFLYTTSKCHFATLYPRCRCTPTPTQAGVSAMRWSCWRVGGGEKRLKSDFKGPGSNLLEAGSPSPAFAPPPDSEPERRKGGQWECLVSLFIYLYLGRFISKVNQRGTFREEVVGYLRFT